MTNSPTSSATHYLRSRTLIATGTAEGRGFRVFKGAQARIDTGTIDQSYRAARQQLVDDGILILDGSLYLLTKDYVFRSSSAAASILAGRQLNGVDNWLPISGQQTLKALKPRSFDARRSKFAKDLSAIAADMETLNDPEAVFYIAAIRDIANRLMTAKDRPQSNEPTIVERHNSILESITVDEVSSTTTTATYQGHTIQSVRRTKTSWYCLIDGIAHVDLANRSPKRALELALKHIDNLPAHSPT